MKYTSRVTRITIAPENAWINDELSTHVEIADEAAGEFIKISRDGIFEQLGEIAIDPEEWPILKITIEKMIKSLRANEPKN
jgi:hypothetical protein